MIQFGVCDETHQSDAVFIGTVETVAPPILASLPAAETARLQSDSSPEALEKLKSIYLDRMFTGIAENARTQIAAAKTQHELQQAFEAVQSEGRVARFRVRTLYKGEAAQSLDIWTGGGDCGLDFQVGETYLVYAIEDEDSGKLETSVCMRTRRLSEEKGDLAYLYFLQNGGDEATRLEGFVSSSFADQNLPRYENGVAAPSRGALLELDSGGASRYTQSDGEGRFSFDGLKSGDYRLSLLAAGFPRTPRTVVLSHGFHAEANACVRQIFILPAR